MLILKLILQNIFAHKLRSLIIFLVITLISTVVFLFLAFSDGELENFRQGVLALLSPSADIVIHEKGYTDALQRNEKLAEQLAFTIKDYPSLRSQLVKEFPFIKSIYHNTEPVRSDLYANGKRFTHLTFRGIDTLDADYVKSRVFIPEGEFLNENDKSAVLINDKVKKRLNVKLGDTLTIIGRDLFGQAAAQSVKIKGFFKSNIDNPHLNSLVLVDMDTYYLISGFYKGEALYVNINLKNDYRLDDSVAKLNMWAASNNPNIEFFDYFKVHPVFAHEYETVRLIIIAICLVVVFIVTFGIMNVVSVNLFDRKKEIGTYYCLGTEKSFLIWLYSAEMFIVNFAASVCGVGLGLIIRFVINSAHITTTEEALQHVFGGNVFYIGLSISTIAVLLLGIGGLTLITALATLGGSLKVSPVVAIREVEE